MIIFTCNPGERCKFNSATGNCYCVADDKTCGADDACDEKWQGEYCGTNGMCTGYCSCCEASDSDNGKNYAVRGTAKGYNTTSWECETKTDYCLSSSQLVEYYIENRILKAELKSCNCVVAEGKCSNVEICNDDSDNDNDGSKDCLDSDCCGKVKSGNIICCTPPSGKTADQCCADANSKYACNTGTHECRTTCSSNQQCQQGYCCTDDPKGPGNRKFECVDRGIYSDNKQYLCDPPGWEAEEKQDFSRIPLFFFSSFNPFA